jgi:hypothetical protein
VANEPTYYEVMGLESGATADDVRRRFRELARKYHPDLNRDHPEYHEVFVRISQAYEVLSDANRRARYDLDLRDRARREAFNASYGPANGAARPTAASPPPGANGRPQNGGGAAQARGAAQSRGAAQQARQRREAEIRKQAVIKMMEDARNAYARGHLAEALRLCNEVLQLGRVGAAHELMGDVYARQSRFEEAVSAYTLAAQMLPANGLVMAKLNRAAGQMRGPQPGPQGSARHVQPSNRAGYKMAWASFGFAVVLFLIVWGGGAARGNARDAILGEWTGGQMGMFALCGFLTGAILAAGTWVRPIDQELFFTGVGAPRRGLPLGILLMVIGALFFPAACLAYAVFAGMREALSRSVVAALLATVVVTLGFVLVADRAQLQTLLFGGNIVFVSLMIGWILGDLFRPGWAA